MLKCLKFKTQCVLNFRGCRCENWRSNSLPPSNSHTACRVVWLLTMMTIAEGLASQSSTNDNNATVNKLSVKFYKLLWRISHTSSDTNDVQLCILVQLFNTRANPYICWAYHCTQAVNHDSVVCVIYMSINKLLTIAGPQHYSNYRTSLQCGMTGQHLLISVIISHLQYIR